MNLQSLVFFLALSFLMVGCDFGMDKAYSEMVEVIEANNSTLERNIEQKIQAMGEKAKNTLYYKPLVRKAAEIQKIILNLNKHISNSDIKFNRNKSKEIEKKIVEERRKIITILNELSKNKTLGIREKEIQDLCSKFLLSKVNEISNQATLVILKNDALLSNLQVTDFLASKIGNPLGCGFDKLLIMSSPKKNFLTKDEIFETDIFIVEVLNRKSRSIKVNGKEIPTRHGVATYKTKSTQYGEHSYDVEIVTHNPHNGKIETYKKTFKYEVGERCY